MMEITNPVKLTKIPQDKLHEITVEILKRCRIGNEFTLETTKEYCKAYIEVYNLMVENYYSPKKS